MTTLRQGDRGPAVRELQFLLLVTGHDPGPLDGIFGPMTLRAWVDSQVRADALPDDLGGKVGDDDVVRLRTLPRRAVEMPRILTPVSAVDMRIALVAGYAAVFLRPDEPAGVNGLAVRVALAQLAVEHGCEPWLPKLTVQPWLSPRGVSFTYVWNFNIGNRQVRREDIMPAQESTNLHRPARPQKPWFSMSPMEGSGAAAHRVTSAHYAYPNSAEGAAAYWGFLRDHCAAALAEFERGDPAAAAHELKVGAWHYTGDEHDYARGMVNRFRSFAK